MLEMRGITKRFPGVVALDGVEAQFFPGEIVAVMGENGAGKSTLLALLGGLLPPTRGEVGIDGEPADRRTLAAASAKASRSVPSSSSERRGTENASFFAFRRTAPTGRSAGGRSRAESI